MDVISLSTKTARTRVATLFGLRKVIAVRSEDGVAAIELQASGLLYLRAQVMDQVDVVPALVGGTGAHTVGIRALTKI